MEVLHHKDPTENFFWREIRSRNYCALKSLQTEYDKRGWKSWFNLFNSCEGIWMLTLKPPKENGA